MYATLHYTTRKLERSGTALFNGVIYASAPARKFQGRLLGLIQESDRVSQNSCHPGKDDEDPDGVIDTA